MDGVEILVLKQVDAHLWSHDFRVLVLDVDQIILQFVLENLALRLVTSHGLCLLLSLELLLVFIALR